MSDRKLTLDVEFKGNVKEIVSITSSSLGYINGIQLANYEKNSDGQQFHQYQQNEKSPLT